MTSEAQSLHEVQFSASFHPKRWWMLHRHASDEIIAIVKPGTSAERVAEVTAVNEKGRYDHYPISWETLFLSGEFKFLNFSVLEVGNYQRRELTVTDSFTSFRPQDVTFLLNPLTESIFRRYIYHFDHWRRLDDRTSAIPDVVTFSNFDPVRNSLRTNVARMTYQKPHPFFKFIRQKKHYQEPISNLLSLYRPVIHQTEHSS